MPRQEPEPIASRRIVAADTLGGERVIDRDGNEVGSIEDLLIDVPSGDIAYAVMAHPLAGGRRVTVPWNALCRDDERDCFVLEDEANR